MGNWSINPNTLASIDDNGKATFQEHTQDTNYTIKYNDGTSDNITKTFTVYACSQPPVDCSAYNFDDLTPGMAHTAFERIPIAQSNYNKEQLSWTINDNWITDVAVSSYEPAPGAICWRYGIGVVANPTTDERNGSVTFTSTDGCSFTGHCTQAGQPAAEWVDLGLPSGKLWRAWNVGTSSESKYGNYYQYGKGSRQYAATSAETSYTGTENPLSSSLDAATQALNNANVHMPTVTEYKELTANTTYSNVTINGISGGKFTSSNGNYIFLPFGGEYKDGTKELVGSRGCYLSSTPNSSTSINRINVNSNGTYYDGNYRTLGLMVRPVSGTTTCPQYQIVPDTQVACSGGTVHFTATTDTCTCNKINVSITELNISADSALTQVGTITTNDCIPNVTYESTQPTWLSGVTYISNDIRIKCSENTTYNSRSGSVNVKMNGNTCSTVNVTQAGKPTPQPSVTISWVGLPADLKSGGLSVTGSTYTIMCPLAGPNAGKGTLYGTLNSSDTRDKMAFSGEFTLTSGGGNIVNACDGTSTSYKYAVYTASWNATTRTLNVTFGACS